MNPRQLFTITIVLSVTVTLLTTLSSASQCTFTPNVNITAADIAPAKFVVSSADCCNFCWENEQCQAAIFANYFCHLKGTTDGQVTSIGATLVLMQRTTSPPPITSSTPAPPPTTTTTTTTTAAPAAPSTTTAAPSGTVTIVREVNCQYSASCNRMKDYSCTTAVYFNDQCSDKTIRDCQEHAIAVSKFPTEDCSGPATYIGAEPLNVCKMTSDETYEGHYCDVQPLPTPGLTLVRTMCPYGCNDGTECTVNKFTTGSCQTNPFSSLAGQSVIASCFAQYVVYSAYGSLDCSGLPSQSLAEPVGTKCFLDNNQEHIQNVCG